MFIKLPSGIILQIEKIVRVGWDKVVTTTLHVFTVEDNEPYYLYDEDAKRLYEYLESIAIA